MIQYLLEYCWLQLGENDLDTWQSIQKNGLTALLDQTVISLRTFATISSTPRPASPYWQQAGEAVTITPRETAVISDLLAQEAALRATLGATVNSHDVQFALPEVVFEKLFGDLVDKTHPVAYVAFRNRVYLQLLQLASGLHDAVQKLTGENVQFIAGPTDQASGALVGVVVKGIKALAEPSLTWWRDWWWYLLSDTAISAGPDLSEDIASWLSRFPAGETERRATATAWRAPGPSTTTATLQLPGYTQFRLDTQLMLKTAYAAGDEVAVIDAHAELIDIARNGRHTWLQYGTATSLNDTVATTLGRNKVAAKHVLGNAGLPVPRAAVYAGIDQALHDFRTSFEGKSIVLKPVAQTHGKGVASFLVPPTEAAFKLAFNEAAEYGSVMVELLAKGTAYRVLVVDGHVIAALECIPANVVGDGRRSIKELIEAKNSTDLRAAGTLPALPQDAKTTRIIAGQGMTMATVPGRAQQVFLRYNSNFDSGGEGVDVTEDMAPSYKQLAVTAAKALHQRLAVVHLQIANLYQAYVPDQEGQVAILGSDPLPHLVPFAVPVVGKAQPVYAAILDALLN